MAQELRTGAPQHASRTGALVHASGERSGDRSGDWGAERARRSGERVAGRVRGDRRDGRLRRRVRSYSASVDQRRQRAELARKPRRRCRFSGVL